MSVQSSRRDFLKTTAMAGVGILAGDSSSWARGKSANERVAFGCIGVHGKGESDTADAARLGDVVAICDVSEDALDDAAKKYPKAKRFNDYRKMIDEFGKSLDAVTVSIPDHNHAAASSLAMDAGKACFTQKPLAHSVYEVRKLAEIARHKKVATQMGNQGTASDNLRRHAAMIKAGALGKVTEVHVWTNRPIWPQGQPKPADAAAPANLHWDLWLGPAADRPYADGYCPFVWRGYWDFGTGALGDMACHTVNLPFMALDLRDPISVEAHTSGTNHYTYPNASQIEFKFPANAHRGPVTMTWYDGGNKPHQDLLPGKSFEGSGSLIIGDKGKLYMPGDYGDSNGTIVDGVEVSNITYPKSPGHFEEFIRAIKTGEPAMSNFPNYSGPLAETILLGNLAIWPEGKIVQWDAKGMRAKNAPEVEHIIHPVYRAGYTI